MTPIQLLSRWVLTACVAFLMIDPALWLVETWANSGYDSAGGHFFALAAGLAIWSISSRLRDNAHPSTFPWGWIGVAVALRLIGYLLAIPYISALAIPVVVYALAQLAALDRRRRAISPFWLAVFVGLTLPVEHVVKKLFGYGLQHLAADGACSLLGLIYADITCAGLDITLRGHELFVDLSCSGARTLLLFSFLFAGLAALVRPGARQAATGFGLALSVGLIVNSLRISLLTAGLASAAWLGFDVMERPWHMRVGLSCLPVGLVAMALWARWVHRISPADRDARTRRTPDMNNIKGAAVTLFGLAVALVVSFGPQFPVHTSYNTGPLNLPAQLAGHSERLRAAGDVERRYFERYGGSVAIADYGPHTLLVVETNAPLRHLHTPEQWLGDAGFSVEKLGHTPGLLPADTYRVERIDLLEGTEGRSRRLDVTYVSDGGRIATSVAEAIWYWLSAPTTTWRVYFRFHPLDTPPSRRVEFDRQLTQFFGSSPFSIH